MNVCTPNRNYDGFLRVMFALRHSQLMGKTGNERREIQSANFKKKRRDSPFTQGDKNLCQMQHEDDSTSLLKRFKFTIVRKE